MKWELQGGSSKEGGLCLRPMIRKVAKEPALVGMIAVVVCSCGLESRVNKMSPWWARGEFGG